MNTPTPHHSIPPQRYGGKLSYETNRLYFDSISLERLADDVQTPFFLVSERSLEANYHAIQYGLSTPGPRALIRYCAKTNNEAGVLRVLAGLGSSVLVSHLAEAQLALHCGFPPERIAFQRPVLDGDEVRRAVSTGINFFHAFRATDLDLLDEIASEQKATIRISLRLKNKSFLSTFNPLGFYSQRLGFGAKEILAAVERIQKSEWLMLEAINFYRGTQQENPTRYHSLLNRSAQLAKQVYELYGIAVKEINLGGGLPSPSMRKLGLSALRARLTFPATSPASDDSLEAYAHSLSAQFAQEFSASGLPEVPRIAVEPGRSIVGNATLLITRVRAVHGRWAFLDASHNYLGENPYLFTRMILPCRRHVDCPTAIFHLSGSTLNTLDVIDVGRRLPRLEPGDLLALCDAGAYSISRANRYAGITPPVYLLRSNGDLECIRRAGDTEDLTTLMTDDEKIAQSVQ